MEKTRQKKSSATQSYSVLQADQLFVKKILSRNSSFGDRSSHQLDSFRASAEVPFEWESRPGEPKDKPKTTEPPLQPTAHEPHAPSYEPPEAHAPPRASRPALVPALMSRARVKRFLKKIVDKGQRSFSVRKHVCQPARFSSSVAAARGFHSGEIGRVDSAGLAMARARASHVAPSSSNSSFNNNNNNLGFSTAPVSPWSSPSSSSNNFNLRLEKPSRLQNFSKGCMKFMF